MIEGYLSLLGMPRAEPSLDYLFALHRAHVSRVPYTNLEIMRGRVTPIDPLASMRQILAGKGGYCFHLNGALSWLLRQLGFSITLHRGYVQRRVVDGEAPLNHLVLLAHDLGGVWLVDAGLGDAIHEPLPLAPGGYTQGPFHYELAAAPPGRWRFTHDERGSFLAMEFESAAARIDDFAAAHERLSTSPDSAFRRFLTVQVRSADRLSVVRGCTATVIDSAGRREWTLDSLPEWSATLAGLGVHHCADLWPATRESHEAWLASR